MTLVLRKFREKRKLEFRLVKSKLSFAEEEIEEVTTAIGEPSSAPPQSRNRCLNADSAHSHDCVINMPSINKDCRGGNEAKEVSSSVCEGENGSVEGETTSESSSITKVTTVEADSVCSTQFKTRRKIGKDPTVDTSYLPVGKCKKKNGTISSVCVLNYHSYVLHELLRQHSLGPASISPKDWVEVTSQRCLVWIEYRIKNVTRRWLRNARDSLKSIEKKRMKKNVKALK